VPVELLDRLRIRTAGSKDGRLGPESPYDGGGGGGALFLAIEIELALVFTGKARDNH
jgi:hypothetical protein